MYSIGDRVVLDNKVPGSVHGFYNEYVVFASDYKFGKVMYGRMPMRNEPEHEDPGNEEVRHKILTLSLIICHPDNLKPEAEGG